MCQSQLQKEKSSSVFEDFQTALHDTKAAAIQSYANEFPSCSFSAEKQVNDSCFKQQTSWGQRKRGRKPNKEKMTTKVKTTSNFVAVLSNFSHNRTQINRETGSC